MQPTLNTGAEGLEIRWSDGTIGTFPYIWLRDTDPSGFHPKTGERTLDLTAIPLDVTPLKAEITPQDLLITWDDQDAPSRFSWPMIWPPEFSFQSQTRARKSSRLRSVRRLPSSVLSFFSTCSCVAMPAWS